MDWIHFSGRVWFRGGARTLREPMDSNKSFPVMSTLRIVFAAFEILRHMLD